MFLCKYGFAPALTIGLALQLAILPAFSQKTQHTQLTSSTAPATPKNSAASNLPKKPKSAAQVELENYFQKIERPMSLPDVPEIGGQVKYRFGLQRSDPKTGRTSIGQRYGTSSSEKDVIDFYKNSLIASKWVLSCASTTNLQASKGNKQLTINIMPKGSPDVRTDFMVNYAYSSR